MEDNGCLGRGGNVEYCFQGVCIGSRKLIHKGSEEVFCVVLKKPPFWRGFYIPTQVITFPEDLMPFQMQP
jgi:hypothetical protein